MLEGRPDRHKQAETRDWGSSSEARHHQQISPRPEFQAFDDAAPEIAASAAEILGLQPTQTKGKKPSRKVLRRLERIEALPPHQQAILLKTIDTFIRGAGA